MALKLTYLSVTLDDIYVTLDCPLQLSLTRMGALQLNHDISLDEFRATLRRNRARTHATEGSKIDGCLWLLAVTACNKLRSLLIPRTAPRD